MSFDFDGARRTAAWVPAAWVPAAWVFCALVLAGAGAARAQDSDDMAAPDEIAPSQQEQLAPAPPPTPADQTGTTRTTTRTTTTSPDGYRSETRTTQGNRTTTSGTSTQQSDQRSGAAAQPEEPEGDGRAADIVWIEAIGGYSFVNMRAISYDNLYPSVVQLSGSGYAAGLAAGVRISFLSIGGRATLASYTGFEVGTAALEVTLRLPTPVVEPWIRAGFGYGWHGTANYNEPTLSDTTVYGYVVQGAVGIDIYLGKVVAIGAGFDVDVLNMSRQPLTTMPVSPAGVDLTKDGNAVGLQLRGHVAISLHF